MHRISAPKIAIIYTSPEEKSSRLFEKATELLGDKAAPIPDKLLSKRSSQRFSYIETEILRRCNKVVYHSAETVSPADFKTMRRALMAAFRSADWQGAAPRLPIQTPVSIVEATRARAEEMIQAIGALHWPLREFGDRAALAAYVE
ncbi:MAG: hypothetical protein AcusKO_33870 [Acuticoccus sp.]